MKLLLIGDESTNRQILRGGLAAADCELATVTTPTALERALSLGSCDFVVLNWAIASRRRGEILKTLRHAVSPPPLVAIVSGERDRTEAQEAGAVACLQPPVVARHFYDLLQPAAPVEPQQAPAVVVQTPESSISPGFISASPLMRSIFHGAHKAAATPATILITGENGTGKTMLARAVHQRSVRRDRPFVTVNCPSLQARLVESELFGHVRGSFTGAIADAVGKVTAAEGGTLFLDEVGELPVEIQPKLLRLLQDRVYERLGETKQRTADVRVIAATNRDLKIEVANGRFREDLFYRLNVIPLQILPLRHRPEDVIPSARQFLSSIGRTMGRVYNGFTPEAREILMTHRWPGNLRELRNAIERAAILSNHSTLDAADFDDLAILRSENQQLRVGDFVPLDALVEEHVRLVSENAGNYQEAARVLGINTSTLYRWRKRAETRVACFEAEPLAERAS